MRTFQSLELFEDLSVEDNLLVAAQPARWYDSLLDIVRLNHTICRRRARRQIARRRRPERRATQQSVEPAAGLDTAESQVLGQRLRTLPASGASVLLIDHDMGLVLSVCDNLYVLDFGRIIADGTPSEVRSNPVVIHAYLPRLPPTPTSANRAYMLSHG